jgi:hypothetical protein
MKKSMMFLAALLMSILATSGIAMATSYALDFDADGTGTLFDFETISGWDLEAVATESINGSLVDMVTHQSVGADGILNNGDTFTELLTVQILNSLGPYPTYAATPVAGAYSFLASTMGGDKMPALYGAFNLAGDISNYSNGGDGDTTLATLGNLVNDTFSANFTGGTGTMFADLNDNGAYDAGEEIAGFTLIAGDTFELDPTVFSGGSSDITLAFKFDSVDGDYFDADVLQDLIDQSWLLTFAQGSIALLDGQIGANPPNEILLGFQETGLDAKFSVVPEPGTIVLVGLGLVGLVGLGARRRSSK